MRIFRVGVFLIPLLGNPFFMFSANFIFVVSHLKIYSFKYFESSDVLVAKKKSLLKVY